MHTFTADSDHYAFEPDELTEESMPTSSPSIRGPTFLGTFLGTKSRMDDHRRLSGRLCTHQEDAELDKHVEEYIQEQEERALLEQEVEIETRALEEQMEEEEDRARFEEFP